MVSVEAVEMVGIVGGSELPAKGYTAALDRVGEEPVDRLHNVGGSREVRPLAPDPVLGRGKRSDEGMGYYCRFWKVE